jgi:CMP-N,N'-diacetyllegionaminic acid synthase
MNILITICARGGSKGIPGKNIKLLNNLPLIAYSIKVAKQFAELHNGSLVLSTDSIEIKQVAAAYGLETDYVRPDFLASDSAGKKDTIKDLVVFEENKKGITYDYVLDLDVTSPLRNLQDLEAAFETFKADDDCVTLFSVNKANRNPYFNMVEESADGYYTLCKQIEGNVQTRQSAPKVFDLNASFYFYKRRYFDLPYNSPITDRSLIYVMPHLCFDLDEPLDFEFMTYLFDNGRLDFSL